MQKLILSSDVKVTWEKGKIAINASHNDSPYTTDEVAVLSVLDEFSRQPVTSSTAMERLKERGCGDLPDDLKTLIETLKTQKILIPRRLSHEEFFKILNEKRRGMDFLKYDDWDMTVSNCGKENLSPGCQSCKEGGWICVFPSFACNAACKFCPRLTREMLEKPLVNQINIDLMLMSIDANKDKISGVAVSGGELFFKNYDVAKKFIGLVRKRYPDVYLWAYTNGIAANQDNMRELRDLGLDELRFNLAATDFDQNIINKIRNHAVKIFPWVSVEAPIYDESRHHLIEREKLKELYEIGVKQLNLAEIRVPSPGEISEDKDLSPAGRHFLDFEELYQFDYMSFKVLCVVMSRLYTYDVFEYAHRRNINIRINDCSQEAKFVQIARRTAKGLARISKDVDVFAKY